ncbi:aldo/keto reductase [Jiangella asiatica]|uniref:Aldo/keto reductase n=1 Tax=Jiangella asiatica TaxID=2530372 RepID=A0A4V2Z2D4_9ACTN|nr:aldo/keto reductase [Jiangella asiatica]TDE08438.1 aldo/keto reductase [Jiangella asiatica]
MTTRLILGAMNFGTTVDETTSFALLDRFVERGGEWIDTADCYSFWNSETGYGGQSEALIGRWLAARPGMRERVKIATKLGAEPRVAGRWPTSRTGLSAAAVHDAFEGSLRRLGVDAVDLLWLHMEDRFTPIEETAAALAELTESGRTTRVGASNHPVWRVERARQRALATGARPMDALQHNHTYLRARPHTQVTDHRFGVLSDEHLDYAAENGLELWAYSPLIVGAYDNPAKPIPEVYDHSGTTDRLAVLTAVARELGLQRGQVVLSWLAGGDQPIRPILGGSKLDQLDTALDGVAFELPAELRARLDDAVPADPGPAQAAAAAQA